MRRQIIFSSLVILTSSIAWADPTQVSRSCAAGLDCTALVNQEIAGMRGTQAAKDKAVADLVVSIGQESQTANSKSCKNMADAVRASASSVSDAEQRARISEVADSMCAAQIQTAALGDDTAAGENDNDGGDRRDVQASGN
jgi:hypothetical protein